jgi:hypothetical protein
LIAEKVNENPGMCWGILVFCSENPQIYQNNLKIFLEYPKYSHKGGKIYKNTPKTRMRLGLLSKVYLA